MSTLPVISLEKLRRPVGDRVREDEIARLREVTHTIGFFHLADHGVPADLERRLFAATKAFFALPEEKKEEISNLRNPHYRGYARLGDEYTQGLVDWREQIDYGPHRPAETEDLDTRPWRILEGPNPWPSALPELETLVTQWQDHLTAVGLDLLRAWAVSLGQAPDFFDAPFEKPHPLLKLVHYPGHDGSESGQGVGAHSDVGVLTLLLLEKGSTGLQVQTADGWIDVPALPGHFVVNIGELLEAATDGYLRATPHRVLPTAPGRSRYSLPFFLNPDLDSRFPRVPLPRELAARAPGRGRDLHDAEIFDVTGRNNLKSRLRAHPATTARYHADLAARVAAGV